MERNTRKMRSAGICIVLAIAASMMLMPITAAGSDPGNAVVNINTADIEQLQLLPGIGASRATAIVEYRSANGPFKSVDELVNIQGIGNSLLDKVRDLVRTK